MRIALHGVTLALALALAACGSDPGTAGDGGPFPDSGVDDDTLETAMGCTGVYNPDQVLDFHLTMSNGDWSSLKADTTNSVYYPAGFQCNDEPPLPFQVGVRRKRSGGTDKPGLKIDFNELTPGAEFQSLKKMSLENGISEGTGTAEMGDVVAEYLAWRIMSLSGAHSGRAVFARVFVNGEPIGTYVNVEQVDKRFLRSRIGDDSGWLYKHSGSPDDGYKTNELVPNPYEADLCFWQNNPCPAPSAAELETYLPMHLDVEQMLRFGGVNALIANTDSPIGKNNNYYWYDWAGGPRVYFPWDLDTTMKDTSGIFAAGQSTMFTDVLFTHWEDDFDTILTTMIEGPLTLAVIQTELDRVVAVSAGALDGDPAFSGGAAADAVGSLGSWWQARHAQVSAELAAHAP